MEKQAKNVVVIYAGDDWNQEIPIAYELTRHAFEKWQMMALEKGSVVTLETGLADHVDLFLNDALIARGEIVAVGDKYGVRIVEVARAK